MRRADDAARPYRRPRWLVLAIIAMACAAACTSARSPGPDGTSASPTSPPRGSSGATGSTAAGPTTGTPAGTTTGASSGYRATLTTMTVAGERRSYLIEQPASGARDRPLIVFLHGAGNSASGVRQQLAMDGAARRAGVVLVYPNGDPVHHSWRIGCCGPFAESPNDFTFVVRIIRNLVASGVVDAKEIALGGFSIGGFFANTFACRYPDLVRGVFAIAGALLEPPAWSDRAEPATPRCTPSRPVTVLELHGSADPSVPVSGSLSACKSYPCTNGTPGYLPPASSVDLWWRQIDGCAPPTHHTSDGVSVQLARCRSGTSVGLAVVPGVGHDLPALVSRFPVHATLIELATGRPLSAW